MNLDLEKLQQKVTPIWRKHGKKLIISTIAAVAIIGAYNYYDTHVVKQSPEYMVEQLQQAINNGDRDTVYKLVNLYGLIDETSQTATLLNLKMEDWSNGSDALSSSIERDKFVAAIAENILSNISSEHRIMYTGEDTNIVASGIRMLGINDLSFESISLSETQTNTPVLNLTVHDSNKQDVKYVVHIKLKRVDDRWTLDQLMSADTVIKTRLFDYKENLTESNRALVNLFEKLIKLSSPTVAVQDLPKPDLDPKELFKLSKQEKEDLFKLKSKFKIDIPVLLDDKVQSAKVIITFIDKKTGTTIKEIPVDVSKGSKTITYNKDVDYSDKSQELLVDAIKNNRVVTEVHIQSVTTSDSTQSLKQ